MINHIKLTKTGPSELALKKNLVNNHLQTNTFTKKIIDKHE